MRWRGKERTRFVHRMKQPELVTEVVVVVDP
jgi:hypothetical protein